MIRLIAPSAVVAMALVTRTASANDVSTAFCSSLKGCMAYGRLPCDRSTQECPPCIYIDTKGQTLCFDKVAGTALCPFVNTTADCSGGATPALPPLRNKTSSNTTSTDEMQPSQRPPDASISPGPPSTAPLDASSWNDLSIGLLVTVLLLALVVAAAVVVYIRTSRANAQYPTRPSTPTHYVKKAFSPPHYFGSTSFHHQPPQLHHATTTTMTTTMTTTPLTTSEVYVETQSSVGSGRSMSFCHIMEPPRDDSVVRPSDAF